MNDRDRRLILTALNREEPGEITRILAEDNTLREWLEQHCPGLTDPDGLPVRSVRNWLRLVFL